MVRQPVAPNEKPMNVARIVTAFLILLLGIYVALNPGMVYAPTPKVVLYFLVSLIPAILFGVEASSKFNLRVPMFAFVTGGARDYDISIKNRPMILIPGRSGP